MTERALRLRRARRTDFAAVMHLLAGSGQPVPPPDRATLRRFRNLVADLGADFYLALVDQTLAGLVHVTYARQLCAPPAARIEQLIVAPPFRHRGIGTRLFTFAARRAVQRDCRLLAHAIPNTKELARSHTARSGLDAVGLWVMVQVPAPT